MSIPKVTYETALSVTVSIEHDDCYFERCIQQMKDDNILIHELIKVIHSVGGSPLDKAIAEAYTRGACTIYKLIESQMEGDEMNRIWGDSKK